MFRALLAKDPQNLGKYLCTSLRPVFGPTFWKKVVFFIKVLYI